MMRTSQRTPQLKLKKLNPFGKQRGLIRIYAEYDWRKGIRGFLIRQIYVLIAIVFSIVMAGPLPGPGTPPLIILFFLASYPGKRRFLRWLFKKRSFRVGRYILRRRYRILLMSPRDRKRYSQ